MILPSKIAEFLKKPNFMVLGTLRQDGSAQMTIVWFEYQEEVFKVSVTTERVKYKNVRRDPRVTLVVYDKENPYRYVQVQGRVTNITKEGAHEFIDHLSSIYTGKTPYHGDPEHKQDRVILTISPQRFFANGFD